MASSTTAAEIARSEADRVTEGEKRGEALAAYRRGEANVRAKRAALVLAEGDEREFSRTVKILTRADRAFREIPAPVLERLRSKIASEQGGRGQPAGQIVSGPVVRVQVEALLDHAIRTLAVEQRALTARREELAEAEGGLRSLAARVEALGLRPSASPTSS